MTMVVPTSSDASPTARVRPATRASYGRVVQRISVFHGITILMGPAFEALHTMMSSSLTSSADRETGTIAGPNGTDVDPDVLHGDFEPANPAPTKSRPPHRQAPVSG